MSEPEYFSLEHEIPEQAPELPAQLRALTPARVGLSRTGVSQVTRDLLDFQRAHAQARDAVRARLDAGALAKDLSQITSAEVLRLHSAAPDRTTYLQRPDLGRKLDDPSQEILNFRSKDKEESTESPILALIVADGLSALAVERHSASLVNPLLPQLGGWSLAPLCVVEQGRVAIGDEIGAALGATIAVVLIGERPGLSSPDSLGAYITWDPRPGRTDAERSCISNIRAEGLHPAEAAAQLAFTLREARRLRLTGVALQDATRRLQGG